jgi:sugar/nucleoside kinase (ribokinase family)
LLLALQVEDLRENVVGAHGYFLLFVVEAIPTERTGGSATNAAYAASYFVKPVQQIGIVGNDFEQSILNDLHHRGVMTDGVELVNDSEARQLTNEYSLVKAARKILAMDPKYLIIKKDEHGAMLFYDDHVFYAPAPATLLPEASSGTWPKRATSASTI